MYSESALADNRNAGNESVLVDRRGLDVGVDEINTVDRSWIQAPGVFMMEALMWSFPSVMLTRR